MVAMIETRVRSGAVGSLPSATAFTSNIADPDAAPLDLYPELYELLFGRLAPGGQTPGSD
jgi:hypothetical protein